MSSLDDLTDNINDIRDYMPDIIDAIEDGFDSLDDYIDDLKDDINNRYDDDDEEESENDISNGVINAGDGKGNHDNSADYGPAFGTNDPSWGRSRSVSASAFSLQSIEEDDTNRPYLRPLSNNEMQQMFGGLNKIKIDTVALNPDIVTFKTPNTLFQKANPIQNIDINIGDINLPEVKDVDGFAKAMGTRFSSLMKQELSKI